MIHAPAGLRLGCERCIGDTICGGPMNGLDGASCPIIGGTGASCGGIIGLSMGGTIPATSGRATGVAEGGIFGFDALTPRSSGFRRPLALLSDPDEPPLRVNFLLSIDRPLHVSVPGNGALGHGDALGGCLHRPWIGGSLTGR